MNATVADRVDDEIVALTGAVPTIEAGEEVKAGTMGSELAAADGEGRVTKTDD